MWDHHCGERYVVCTHRGCSRCILSHGGQRSCVNIRWIRGPTILESLPCHVLYIYFGQFSAVIFLVHGGVLKKLLFIYTSPKGLSQYHIHLFSLHIQDGTESALSPKMTRYVWLHLYSFLQCFLLMCTWYCELLWDLCVLHIGFQHVYDVISSSPYIHDVISIMGLPHSLLNFPHNSQFSPELVMWLTVWVEQ